MEEKQKNGDFQKVEDCVIAEAQKTDNNLTLSTKISTDHLICKTPQESPNASVRSLHRPDFARRSVVVVKKKCCTTLYLGILQMVFGFLMAGFGIFVIFQQASLSQIGSGIWGGCLAVATGATGLLAGAKDWCPLKSTPQRIAHTTFLALSLVSLAVSQLVVVLAATGLARDISKAQDEENGENPTHTTPSPNLDNPFVDLPANYLAIIADVGLLLVSSIEVVLAAVSAYRSARALCACFRPAGEDPRSRCDYPVDHHRNALVRSWLGKQNMAHQFYVIAAPPSSLGKGSKLSGGLPVAPMYAIPPPPSMLQPPIMSYPLIPAPLGPVPSPIIRPHPSELGHRNHRKSPKYRMRPPSSGPAERPPTKKRSRSRSKERALTDEDVVRTYTGLDRTIAEEFIEMCDSQNTSLCSESSCLSGRSSACRCRHPCPGCSTTCAATGSDGSTMKMTDK